MGMVGSGSSLLHGNRLSHHLIPKRCGLRQARGRFACVGLQAIKARRSRGAIKGDDPRQAAVLFDCRVAALETVSRYPSGKATRMLLPAEATTKPPPRPRRRQRRCVNEEASGC